MSSADDLLYACPRPAGTHDPVACLSFAVDAMREAFDLVLAVVATDDQAGASLVRVWYLESAIRRVVQAARVMRLLSASSNDTRVVAVADRLDVERRAVLARAEEILGARAKDSDARGQTWRCA